MNQDYTRLSLEEHDLLEKQTLRTAVQAMQEYSAEAKFLFETTEASSDSEVIVLGEDIVQYALEVAESYPINRRYAGFIDYKRIRWISTIYGIFPQAFLVDAKAATENSRDTLQQSQLPMDADFTHKNGTTHSIKSTFHPHIDIPTKSGNILKCLTTSVFVHFYYKKLDPVSNGGRYRELKTIYILCVPHQNLKPKYNPTPQRSFFGIGKHSPARNEEPRVRVYFDRLRKICPWRIQELTYPTSSGTTATYTIPLWRDVNNLGDETSTPFEFLAGR